MYICELCGELTQYKFHDEKNEVGDVVFIYRNPNERPLCAKCIKDGWKFTEHGVLINETPVKKRGTTK